MDDLVYQAMRKWPNVPDCYGWLGLDARGEYWMRDMQVQQAGSFKAGCQSPLSGGKGSRVDHVALKGFMGRNYQPDERGCWYFQNGPQKVFVELELAPLSCRLSLSDTTEVLLHTGAIDRLNRIWVDEMGVVYAEASKGLAVVHSWDVAIVANWLEAGFWSENACNQADLPSQFGYVLSPMGVEK